MSENSVSGKKNVATMDFTSDPEVYTPPTSHKDLRSAKREGIDLYRVVVPKYLNPDCTNQTDIDRTNYVERFIEELKAHGMNVEVIVQ